MCRKTSLFRKWWSWFLFFGATFLLAHNTRAAQIFNPSNEVDHCNDEETNENEESDPLIVMIVFFKSCGMCIAIMSELVDAIIRILVVSSLGGKFKFFINSRSCILRISIYCSCICPPLCCKRFILSSYASVSEPASIIRLCWPFQNVSFRLIRVFTTNFSSIIPSISIVFSWFKLKFCRFVKISDTIDKKISVSQSTHGWGIFFLSFSIIIIFCGPNILSFL